MNRTGQPAARLAVFGWSRATDHDRLQLAGRELAAGDRDAVVEPRRQVRPAAGRTSPLRVAARLPAGPPLQDVHTRTKGYITLRYVYIILSSGLSHRRTKKGKVFPYSLPSVGPGADPGVQAVSSQVTK